MDFKYKSYANDFRKDTSRNVDKLLMGVGIEGVFIARAENCPVISGLFSNSITYKIDNGQGGQFGSISTGKGDSTPTENDRVSQPQASDTVRIGTAVIYAEKVEKKHGTLANSFDVITRGINNIVAKVFGSGN